MLAVSADGARSGAVRCCLIAAVARGVSMQSASKSSRSIRRTMAQPFGAEIRRVQRVWRPPVSSRSSVTCGGAAATTNRADSLGMTAAAAATAVVAVACNRGGRSGTLARALQGSRMRDERRSATSMSASARSLRSLSSFNFTSPEEDVPDGGSSSSDALPLPPMSRDGGNEAEFQIYWPFNRKPRPCGDGWLERLSHPQVNIEPYWYNPETDEFRWQPPPGVSRAAKPEEKPELDGGGEICDDGLDVLTGVGPAWEKPVPELKEIMRSGEDQELGIDIDQLARRAVANYEEFTPRVLSWHDYQHITFWFYGGMDDKGEKGKGKGKGKGNDKAFFNGRRRGATKDLFAKRPFFQAAAKVLQERLHRMHPICITYFVWTFARAEVVVHSLMEAVGDHLCNGRIPMMDRCALGTMLWNYQKLGVKHDRFFEVAAAELARPNRLRSLAPRNFQNTMIAYGRQRHWNARLLGNLARGIRRQLDAHDPKLAKLDISLCFAYTCRDGYTVDADSFRVNGLTVILKMFHRMPVSTPSSRACVASMVDYVNRMLQSRSFLREPGDACEFFTTLGYLLRDVPDFFGDEKDAEELLPAEEDLPRIQQKASGVQERNLEQSLEDARASLARLPSSEQLEQERVERGQPVRGKLQRRKTS